jgi:hypothetical protein
VSGYHQIVTSKTSFGILCLWLVRNNDLLIFDGRNGLWISWSVYKCHVSILCIPSPHDYKTISYLIARLEEYHVTLIWASIVSKLCNQGNSMTVKRLFLQRAFWSPEIIKYTRLSNRNSHATITSSWSQHFYLFNHYSHMTYIDHGDVLTVRFPPQSDPDFDQSTGGTLQLASSPLPSAQASPKKMWSAPWKLQRKVTPNPTPLPWTPRKMGGCSSPRRPAPRPPLSSPLQRWVTI